MTIEEVLERHVAKNHGSPTYCGGCPGLLPKWPCDAVLMAQQLQQAQGRVAALEGALRWIVETGPPLGSWDGWRFVTQIRDYARTVLSDSGAGK